MDDLLSEMSTSGKMLSAKVYYFFTASFNVWWVPFSALYIQ